MKDDLLQVAAASNDKDVYWWRKQLEDAGSTFNFGPISSEKKVATFLDSTKTCHNTRDCRYLEVGFFLAMLL